MKYNNKIYGCKAVVNYKDLESFLAYLEDKREDVSEMKYDKQLSVFFNRRNNTNEWWYY